MTTSEAQASTRIPAQSSRSTEQRTCTYCEGVGMVIDLFGDSTDCPICEGSGQE